MCDNKVIVCCWAIWYWYSTMYMAVGGLASDGADHLWVPCGVAYPPGFNRPQEYWYVVCVSITYSILLLVKKSN